VALWVSSRVWCFLGSASDIVVLSDDEVVRAESHACIRCGRCLEACPLVLEPDQVSLFVEAGRPLETERFGANECYECGCCTYVCPAGRPLVQFMQVAKSALRRAEGTKV